MRTGSRLILAAVLAALAGTALAVPAQAAACEEGRGVTVVVDFASLGGGVQTDCAPGDPASGVEALRGSGHEPTRAAQQPGYFLCRIDGKPADDPCQRASPENAYWSYWHARPGGTWTYSNTGPAERDPAPGTVEGWAFGAGDPPSIAPPRERSAAPPPAPSPTPAASSPKAAAPSPARSVSSPVATPAPAGTAAAPGSAPASPTTAAVASPSPVSSGSPTAAATGSVQPSPEATQRTVAVPRDSDDGAGSLAGPLAALGVVLLLAAGGAYQVSQRRSRETGP